MATHNLLVVADTTSFRIKPPINKNHTPKVSDAMIEEAQKKINSTDTTSEYTLDLFVVLDDRLRKSGLASLKIYKGSGRRYDGEEIEEPDCEIEWFLPNTPWNCRRLASRSTSSPVGSLSHSRTTTTPRKTHYSMTAHRPPTYLLSALGYLKMLMRERNITVQTLHGHRGLVNQRYR
ncbi:MAG: hypothetical protein IPI29_08410 [Ignavibacteria bacterium]|nr:hypothetical protein [Ignavibacteria bacterium]